MSKTPKGRYAWTVKVGEKGQFVIPKEARDLFDIKPGDTLMALGHEKRGIAIPPKGTFARIADKILEEDNEFGVEDSESEEE